MKDSENLIEIFTVIR